MVWQLRGIPIAQKKLRHGPAHGNFQLKNAIFPGNHPQNRPSSAAAFHELHTKALWHVDPAEAWQVEWSPSLKPGSGAFFVDSTAQNAGLSPIKRGIKPTIKGPDGTGC